MAKKKVKKSRSKPSKPKKGFSKKDLIAAKKRAKTEFLKAKKKLVAAEKDIKKYIDANPKKATAIAAGVGAVLAGISASLMKGKKKK